MTYSEGEERCLLSFQTFRVGHDRLELYAGLERR